jgi:FixJ family two-component response regulator
MSASDIALKADMTVPKRTRLVAVVDDDAFLRNALQRLLKAAGMEVASFGTAEDFLKSDKLRDVGCLIADIRMPGMSGLELQATLKAEDCLIPTIFITAHGDEKLRLQAMRAGAVEFLTKPFDDRILLERVRMALER